MGTSTIFAKLVNFLQDKAIINPLDLEDTNIFAHAPPISQYIKKIVVVGPVVPPIIPINNAIMASNGKLNDPFSSFPLKHIISPPPPLPPEDIPIVSSGIKVH